MKKPRYETLLRYPNFRNWWTRQLQSRPNKLYDFETGAPMDIKKRIFRERPKIDDLCRYLVQHKYIKNINMTYDRKSQNWKCHLYLETPNKLIIKAGLTLTIAVEAAVIDFLKTKI